MLAIATLMLFTLSCFAQYDGDYYSDYSLYDSAYSSSSSSSSSSTSTSTSGYWDYSDEYGDVYVRDGLDICTADQAGQPIFRGNVKAPCNVNVTGADKLLSAAKEQRGLDGHYKITSCRYGRPFYRRQDSPQDERILWFSSIFKDWQFSNGTDPHETDVMMWGWSDSDEGRVPETVEDWFLVTGGYNYTYAPSILVTCDGDSKPGHT